MVLMDVGSLLLGVVIGLIGALSGMTTYIILKRRQQQRLSKIQDLEVGLSTTNKSAPSRTAPRKTAPSRTGTHRQIAARSSPTSHTQPRKPAAVQTRSPTTTNRRRSTRPNTPKSPFTAPRKRVPLPPRTREIATQTTPPATPTAPASALHFRPSLQLMGHRRLRSIASTIKSTLQPSLTGTSSAWRPTPLPEIEQHIVSPVSPLTAQLGPAPQPPRLQIPYGCAELPASDNRSFVSTLSETTFDAEDLDYASTILYTELEEEVVPVTPLKGKNLTPVSARRTSLTPTSATKMSLTPTSAKRTSLTPTSARRASLASAPGAPEQTNSS